VNTSQGTAKTSGMLKEGDQLVKVDGVLVKDEHEAQQMLQVHTCTYLRY
jgi:hypothetical protein